MSWVAKLTGIEKECRLEDVMAQEKRFPGERMDSEFSSRTATQAIDTAEKAYRPITELEILTELFTYHSPREDQVPKYAAVRSAAKYFAKILWSNVPPGADRTTAIRLLREAVMTANAGISLNGLGL